MPDHSPDYPIEWSDDGLRATGSKEVRARRCFIHTQTIMLMWSDYDAAVSWRQEGAIVDRCLELSTHDLTDEDRGSC